MAITATDILFKLSTTTGAAGNANAGTVGANYPGPADTGTALGVLISRRTEPLIRLRDMPETTIEKAEVIRPW